jgi:hypothetical protein
VGGENSSGATDKRKKGGNERKEGNGQTQMAVSWPRCAAAVCSPRTLGLSRGVLTMTSKQEKSRIAPDSFGVPCATLGSTFVYLSA